MPISGYLGENLLIKSEKMLWWTGMIVWNLWGNKVWVITLLDALNTYCVIPKRHTSRKLRLPISGTYKIKGVGDVLAGRLEQGCLKPGDELIWLPTHTSANPCSVKVFTIEMHHKKVNLASAGDNVGINVKGLSKTNMPRTGDVMIQKNDDTLKVWSQFKAQIQTLDNIPKTISLGYSPIGFVRWGHAACKFSEFHWKIGKETAGKKLQNPPMLKSNEICEVSLKPGSPIVVDTFANWEGLSRIAFLEGNTPVMLGKIIEA